MDEKFRKNVAALIRQDGRYLMCSRLRPYGAWQLVQGGIEPDETIEEAIFREIAEELGVKELAPFVFVAAAPAQRYRFPPGVEWTIAQKYVGQEQTVCLIDFDGVDDLFDLALDDPPEFETFDWYSRADLIASCWELKRPVVENAFEFFTDHGYVDDA